VESSPIASPDSSTDLFCVNCGYNQRGISADRCPECGYLYVHAPPSPTRLPWRHRRHLGRLKAYWRTTAMVMFRHELFCQQIEDRITLREARQFWLFSMLQAWLPLLAAVLTLYWYPPTGNSSENLEDFYDQFFVWRYVPIDLIWFVLLGALTFLITATGISVDFCHPRAMPIQQQRQAVALTYFASAPLALMPLVVVPLLLARVLFRLPPLDALAKFLGALIAVLMLGLWYVCTVRIILTISQHRRPKGTAALLTATWLLLLIICGVMIPAAIWYIAAMLYGLLVSPSP